MRRYRIYVDWSIAGDGSGYDDYYDEVTASDPISAAEEWAADYDARSADYSIAGGSTARVRVVAIESGEAHEYYVYGKTTVVYSARMVVTP